MKRYIILTNMLLLTVGIYLSVTVFYKIATEQLSQDTLYRATQKPVSSLGDEVHYPMTYYDTITERNLFNTKKESGEIVKQIDVETLKQTELKLKLVGTVTGDENSAYAVIQMEKEKQQNLYRIGDAIQEATLKMILREKVILTVNGRDEVLEIEQAPSTSGRTERRTQRRSSRTIPSPSQNISLRRSTIENAVQDINTLMKQVNIRPHFENGQPAGLRLTRVTKNSIFKDLGLRRGDIITGVDGQTLQSVDDALQLYNRLTSSSNVKIDIKRRGVPKTINYRIE